MTPSSQYMQIEQVLLLESKVRDLQLQNQQLQGENLRLCLQLRQQEDTLSQHLQAYQDSQELVEKLQDEVSLSTSPPPPLLLFILSLPLLLLILSLLLLILPFPLLLLILPLCPLPQIVQYKGRCTELEAALRSQEGVCEEGRGELLVTVRKLEERLVELQRKHQGEREGHHEELRAAIDSVEEHQQRFICHLLLSLLVEVLLFVVTHVYRGGQAGICSDPCVPWAGCYL